MQMRVYECKRVCAREFAGESICGSVPVSVREVCEKSVKSVREKSEREVCERVCMCECVYEYGHESVCR